MSKKIYIQLSTREEEQLLAGWIREYSDVNILDLSEERGSIERIKFHLENKDVDIVILDNSSREIFRELITLFHNLKKAKGSLSPLIMSVLSRDNLSCIFDAIGEDVDMIELKPLEKEPFLLKIDEMLKEISLYPNQRIIININKVLFFLKMADVLTREPYLKLCDNLLNNHIKLRILPVIGEPTISFIGEKLNREFKEFPLITFRNNSFILDEKTIPDGFSTLKIRDRIASYFHSFFKYIQLLTSDILVGRPLDILLVEDNPTDRETVIENLSGLSFSVKVNWVGDGVDAMEYLHRTGKYINNILPDIILLDLNMPRMDGREVLNEIKKEARLCQIPVVIITSCKDECFSLIEEGLKFEHYMVKPVDKGQFIDVVKSVKNERFDALRIMVE